MVEQFRMPEPPFVIQERRDIPHMDVVRASDYAALEALCAAKDKVIYEIDFATVPKLTDRIAALEARCRDYRDALEEIASYRGPDSGMDITARHMRDAAREAIGYETETACEHHWMPATQAGSLAIIGRGCSKCGAWETSPEPNYRFQEPSNLPSQSMTIGAHPGGGPCIHVWALTNRDAVENGRCGICGQSVANRSVKP